MNGFSELEGVRLLWHADYWDGPLAGLARYNGQDYWFEVEAFDWDDPPAERRYLLYSLTEEELAEEREWHHRFQEHVGTHTDYDARGHRDHAAVKPRSEWSKFYDEYEKRSKPDYTMRAPVGWFGQARDV